MTPEQIREKYGIEPIMKEMWVWNNHIGDAELMFVSTKDSDGGYQYCCYNTDKEFYGRVNASETNPNEKEPKVGDKGYFWDDVDCYVYSELRYIATEYIEKKYYGVFEEGFINFSHEKQPWMQ